MAIVFNCPQCNYPYKLKDELAGKRATCKNPDCRQVIQIPAPSGNGFSIAEMGGILPENAGKDRTPVPTNPADLEAAALAALRDSAKEEEDTAAEKAIPIKCEFCAHEWSEPFEKAGKNTLCPNPECRQRVKVPMPKKGDAPVDWRTGGTNKPTLAKENFEKPDDVMSAEAKVVSKAAWQGGGGAEQDLEPITLKRRLFVYSLIGAPILAIALGIYSLVTWRGGHSESVKMEEAIVEFDKGREELSPAQAPSFASILQLASGEYVLYPQKMDKDKALALSLQHFTRARSELQRATGPERFAVAGELAMTQLGLGGTDEQVKEGSRIRWVPDAPSNRPLRVSERVHTVHEELRLTLRLLDGTDFDTKAAIARRLARELAKRGQPGLAVEIPVFLFTDAEMPEAKAIVALELFRADRGSPDARKVADELKAILAGGITGRSPTPASAQTLWAAVGTEKAPSFFAAPSGLPTDPTRLAYVGLYLLQDKASEALELARKPGGSLPGQLRTFALYAEWAADPGPAFDSAISAINLNAKAKKEAVALPASQVLRLSQLAAATGRADQAKQLADLIPDEGLKVWAKGSAIQFAATPGNKTKIEDAALEVPDDAKKLRAGHAWGRLWQARHNTRISSAGDTTKAIAGWAKGTIHPFGHAGIALGQHDK